MEARSKNAHQVITSKTWAEAPLVLLSALDIASRYNLATYSPKKALVYHCDRGSEAMHWKATTYAIGRTRR